LEALAQFDAQTAEGAEADVQPTAEAAAPATAAPATSDYAHQSFLRA
jgi:type III secretion protein HrpB1